MTNKNKGKGLGLFVPVAIVAMAWLGSKAIGATKKKVSDPTKIASTVVKSGHRVGKSIARRRSRNHINNLQTDLATPHELLDQPTATPAAQFQSGHGDEENALKAVATTVALTVAELVLERILESRQSVNPRKK